MALEKIARAYRTPIKAYFRRRIANLHECDDLTQEVMLRLARRDVAATIQAVEPYVFQAAASVLADFFRRRAVRGHGRIEIYQEEIHAPAEFSPERVMLGKEAVDQVHKAIETLPDRARHALLLFKFEGMKQSEIAVHMGISVSAVEKHIKLGMVRLAAALMDTE